MQAKKTRLFVRAVKSIGMVDSPACEGSEIIIAKRAESQPVARTYSSSDKMALPVVAKRDEVVAQLRAAAPAEFVSKMEEVARTFGEINVNAEIREQMNQMTWRLQDSFYSIFNDPNADKAAMLQQSLAEFYAAALAKASTIASKAGRKMAGGRWSKFKTAIDQLAALADELAPPADDTPEEDPMAEKNKAAFDVSKLDDAAKAHVASLEKRVTDADATAATLTEENTALKAENEALKAKLPEDPDDVFKGMSTVAKERFLALEKRAQEAEDKEFVAKAKSLGQGDSFGPVLQRISKGKSTTEDVAELERVLKAQAAQIKEAGLFREIGANGDETSKSAWDEIEAKAQEAMKADPKLNRVAARDLVMQQNPELEKRAVTERRAAH